ncbi:hypothetical protein AB0I54_45190 [Streptomyces sp. NPDC050625]|uniref:hypothetical protein n=1 Tax=Streptomyces sp. NPDC050625 TaxID=3154629 RepID=UPI00344409A5
MSGWREPAAEGAGVYGAGSEVEDQAAVRGVEVRTAARRAPGGGASWLARGRPGWVGIQR